jgi:4'-phosphopantetheinyl transferase
MVSAFTRTLSALELERAARFHFDHHRNRFIVGRGWLRQLLGAYLSIPADRLEFEYSPNGKPALTGSAATGGLQFNLAHSEGLGVVAIAQRVTVGIDVEGVRPLADADDLTRFFSTREHLEFTSLPEDQKRAAFFNLWTRKEAWLKATGDGIADLLARVEVSFVPGEPSQLLRLPAPFPVASWSLCDLVPAPGFAAALAVAAAGAQAEGLRWDHERMNRRYDD